MDRVKHRHADGLPGNDGIADYTLCVHIPERGGANIPMCARCREPAYASIRYKGGRKGIEVGLEQKFGITVVETLLGLPDNVLCLSDWARFQRQVTHIYEKKVGRAPAKAS